MEKMARKGWIEVLVIVMIVLTLFIINISVTGKADFEFSNLKLSLDKDTYKTNETIIITTEPKLLSDDIKELLTLTIKSSTKTYNYIGIPEFPIKFNLQEQDTYKIQLINKKTLELINEKEINTINNIIQEINEEETPIESLNKNKNNLHLSNPINNPGGIILESHSKIKRPISVEQIQTSRGPKLVINNPINAIKSIVFDKLNEDTPPRLGLEDLNPVSVHGRSAVKSYAIDPTTVNFNEATISSIAKGTALYECKDYDFETQECWGHWQKKRNLEPGEIYTFTLTPEDPLYSELNDTLTCGCTYTQTSGDATINCDTTCEYTIQVPDGATSFFLEEIQYNVGITMVSAGTVTSGSQNGYFDNDNTLGNGNEINIGSSTYTSSTTTTWINNNIDETGTQSFNQDNCDNWPNYCTYYIHLDATLTFTTPGNSQRESTVAINLNWVNHTLNYTEPGDFAVILENPENNYYTRADPNQEFVYVPTSADTTIDNCSLYTSEGGWSAKNITTSVQNGTNNFLTTTFSNEGTYNWNVQCVDENSNTATGVLNRIINIDRTSPLISLISPADLTTITDTNVVSFNYEVTDNSPISNCSLIINNTIASTNYNIVNNTEQTINYFLPNGVYEWSIMCYDAAGNNNETSKRTITIDITPVIYTGLWYETSTTNCGTLPCEISVAQQTDGTQNTVSSSINSGQTIKIVEALSPFIGSNGAEISSGSTVSFSTYYSAAGNNLNAIWYLYKKSDTGTDSLICSNTAGSGVTGGAPSTGTCSPGSDVRIFSTDKLYYEIWMSNTHPNQARTFTHVVDYTSSFFNAQGFTQIGQLSSLLIQPNSSIMVGQQETFNLTCEIDCYIGTCLNTNVFAQTNQTGSWTNIASSGIIILGSGQSNPENEGNIYNTTNTVTFVLEGNNPGTANVRCFAESKYSTAISASEKVTIGVTTEPEITLTYPENNSWINDEPVIFRYTPQTYSTLDYCSIYIDGAIVDTDNTPSANIENNFSISGLIEKRYNWSVQCVDVGSLIGNSTTYYFDIDRQAPYNLTIFYPNQPLAEITQSWITFEWIVKDLRSDEMTCSIYVNDILNTTITTQNDTLSNTTIEGFEIGNYTWYMMCEDKAGNNNTTNTYNITITDVPPTIELVYPLNYTGVNTSAITLEYIPHDGFGVQECSLYINETLNQTNYVITANEINTFNINIEESEYAWRISCLDSNSNAGTSPTWTFFGDFTPPTITLQAPIHEAYFSQSSIFFSYIAYDNWPYLTCTINFNSEQIINTTATSGVEVTESISGFPDGYHEWSVMCVDIGGNTNTSETRNLTINQTPTINLNAPINNSQINDLIINLSYTPHDNDGFNYCDLYINDAFNQRNNTEIFSGIINNFSSSGLGEGEYNWSVTCEDSGVFSNINSSNTLFFIIDRTPPNLNLLMPNSSTIVETSSYNFSWITYDQYSSEMICDLYINEELNQSNIVSQNNTETSREISGFLTGIYNWSMSCIDISGNENVSETIIFEVLLPPKITLISPENNTGSTNRNTTFTYVPSEGSGVFNSCSLILNSVVNQTNESIIANVENSFTVTNMPDGAYEWNVECTDTNNITGIADESWIYYVDNLEPYEVNLLNPLNNSIEIRNNVSFTFLAKDAVSPQLYCDIFLTEYEPSENSYGIASNIEVQNNTEYTFHYLLNDGNYSWNVLCVDKANNYNESQENYFEVIAPPNVTLMSPENNTWFNTNNVLLTYFPDDDFQIVSCDLILNGEVNQTNNIIFNKQNNTFQLNNLEEDEYNWTVSCTDSDANAYAPPAENFFVDMTPPSISLHNPLINESLNTSTILFNWTTTDLLSPTLTCDLYINDVVNKTNIIVNNSQPHQEIISGFNDGFFNWSLTCSDLATNTNTSETRNFEVQESPIVSLGNPINNYRNNTINMNLFFTAVDNSGQIDYCTLIVNEEEIENNTNVVSGEENFFELLNLENGSYDWDVICYDFNGNEGRNGTGKTFHVDLAPPIITLISPYVDETFNQNDITFYWNATDFNSSIPLICEIYVTDPLGDRSTNNITGYSGETFNYTFYGLDDGEHFWNVTCVDDLGNSNTSNTQRFVINQPDLYIDNTRINFSNNNPNLNELINITANVSNIGGVDAINATVSFWQGNPDEGGILIGNQTKTVLYDNYEIFWVDWIITEGYHEIYVLADPLNEINELNETNNNATTNISVLRVMIHDPVNNSIYNYENINFNFTLQDYTIGLINYSFFIDGVPDQLGQIQDNDSTQLTLTISEGIREIILRAQDAIGRIKETMINVVIDLTPPTPIITTMNETWFNTSNPEINFTITDNLANNISYKLYVNNSLNSSGYTINNTINSLIINNLDNGVYELILEGEDDAGNIANSTAVLIYVDLIKPTITLEVPDNGANFTVKDILLNYTVFDNMAETSICIINVSGTEHGLFNVDVGVQQSYLVQDLDEGEYYWNVTCSDQAGNTNISETRIFNIFIPPEITLISPVNNYWSNLSTNIFTYYVTDDTGIQQCYLYLNNDLNQSSPATNNDNNTFTVNNMNGIYVWRVECIDNTSFYTRGISENRTINVDLQEPSAEILTINNTWFNSMPEIDFIITDNLANVINYSIYVNGTINVNGTTTNNTQTSTTLSGLSNGYYEIMIEAIDLAGNNNFSNTIYIYYDSQSPTITLNYPDDGNITNSNNVNLSFTPTDNMAPYLMCEVNLNNNLLGQLNVTNGGEEIIILEGLSGGNYYWNVTCLDLASNSNVSETWNFFVPVPDLSVNNSQIYFSNELPTENEEIMITATISNIGVSPAENFIVQFWQNEINVSGNQIGSDIFIPVLNNSESQNVSVNFTVPIGTTEIFVYVNPEGLIAEDNMSNNIASRNISVEFWHYALGTTNDTLRVTDASLGLLFDWNVDNSTGSNIYVTDYDSQISWTTLQALSRDINNNERIQDFALLDIAIGSDDFGDSVNKTYTNNGNVIETINFEIFGQIINNVPVVNSTTSQNFKTGILWDYQSSTEFNGTQNVVFITSINKDKEGYQSNINDFEIRIPATLRNYQGPDTEKVIFYTEIK